MFTLNIISLMFTLVHVHLFSIVFYLRTMIGRLLALGGSGSLWVAMARSGWLWLPMARYGWLWLAMGGYGSLWVAMARYGWLWVAMPRYGSFRCLVPPLTEDKL